MVGPDHPAGTDHREPTAGDVRADRPSRMRPRHPGAAARRTGRSLRLPGGVFVPRCWRIRRPPPDPAQLADAATALSQARAPLIIAGGGVHYALAREVLADFAARHGVPVA